MKILHIDDRFTPQGGVGQYILELSALLTTRGHVSMVVCRKASGGGDATASARVLPAGLPVAIDALQTAIGDFAPDVAMIHHVSSPELIRAVTGLVPAVAYVHGFVAVCPGLGKYFRRGDEVCEQAFGWRCFPTNYLRRCSSARNPLTMLRLMRHTAALKDAYLQVGRYVVGSGYMRELLVQNGFGRAAISVLPPHFVHAEDVPEYAPPGDSSLLLFAGRLEIEKGLPHMIQAMARLPEHVRLVVAGDGTMRPVYEDMVATMGLSSRVEFVGWQTIPDLNHLYAQCAVVVIPSVCPEAFGKVGVEAMAYGRPVVAYNVGGISEWLADGITGVMVEPGHIDGLVSAITNLLVDSAACERMGRAGQAFVRDRFDPVQHAEAMEAILHHTATGGDRG